MREQPDNEKQIKQLEERLMSIAPSPVSPTIISPIKLAHVVLRTSNFEALVAWYKLVLNAVPAFEGPTIAFLAYDDEHHRIAIINIPGLAPQPDGIAGVHHVAFTFEKLSDLLDNHVRLRSHGIEPIWPVNHGPTTSLYYADPDGNQLEFQVDNYESVEEAGKFFYSEAFAINPIGVDFDPDDLRRRLQSGEDEATLKRRPASGPRGVDDIRIR
jgi:catechol-2,3-dioxygenase